MLAWLFDWAWGGPLGLLFLAFALWMLVDALRRGEWLWALFIFLFAPLNAPLYYFLVYRQETRAGARFELPGAAAIERFSQSRQRIRELEARIHHLDNARDHADLGDLYLRQGAFARAEASYRAALERDPEDLDTQAHLGQCLLGQKRYPEALPLLEAVTASEPDHDFGHTLMALAEVYQDLGRTAEAIAAWKRVLERHTYARARVQLAMLYLKEQQTESAVAELREVLADDAHAPSFQRRRERTWVRQARSLLRQVGLPPTAASR
jgi:hypothetical protein